ncbi:hypothetical protein EJ04DRAFT_558586 [Polyplosphaeria fusca]|uniref:YDG domain-containing protein n=1 Tax=Polyplosphaeria fusca TaxID=682080 RepID=A0A9P4RBQ3_9PLEO|nr:hypothetical protein EJ04DRAFT_558586 [Polyplosphaeria fusca]
MALLTSLADDLSRARLKQLTAWIRDDLDPIIAQEGPESLRSDDVLSLHEFFLALREPNSITVLDLRATGIHRAVMEISGIATRWPSRLADDCDRVITAWTAKFGRLDRVYPFMYGRGGRLEGIASMGEFSKGALLARWRTTCPEMLMPARSHRHGDLGFKAGDWWINALFAHHAGIIDLENIEGGICHDTHGAYAVLLKENSEVNQITDTSFVYCPRQEDKGKYRLTAAIFKSRRPVRILRSHGLNSVLGPKAGVRYEGLYRVKGWKILPMRGRSDASQPDDRPGDVNFYIEFEREDITPLIEVFRHPLAAQLDDYAEYKRLRRAFRDQKMTIECPRIDIGSLHTPIPSLAKSASPVPSKDYLQGAQPSPALSRRTTFKVSTTKTVSMFLPLSRSPEPPRSLASSSETSATRDESASRTKQTQLLPWQSRAEHSESHVKQSNSSPDDTVGKMPSHGSSQRSHPTQDAPFLDIKEVAPWVDLEKDDAHGHESNPTGRPAQGPSRRATSADTSAPNPSHNIGDDKKGRVKPIFTFRAKPSHGIMPRSRNPLAKLFDGVKEDESLQMEDYFSYKGSNEAVFQRAKSLSQRPPRPLSSRRKRASSTSEAACMQSPVPFRPISPASPLIGDRRHAVCVAGSDSSAFFAFRGLGDYRFEAKCADYEPALQAFISAPRPAAPGGISPKTCGARRGRDEDVEGERVKESAAAAALRAVSEGQPRFRNPFE